jgi:hypothetical protein
MSRSTVRTPTVEFTLSRKGSALFSRDGETVRRKGVIFRAGDYPTQQFTMTAADLAELAERFEPVPIDHGHPSAGGPLDGEFGTLEAVELSGDRTTLYGTVAFPKWLDEKLGDARRKVSASFDRATKRLRSLSLVTRPQIEDAELLAAFCACHPEAAPAASTPKERKMSRREDDIAALQAMSDEEYEAVEVDTDGDDDEHDDEVDVDSARSNFSADPEAVALRAEVEMLKAERRQERAKAFAAELKAQGRIAPFEEATTASVMFSAMTDDDVLGGTVNFSVGDKPAAGTREAMVRASYAQRIPHDHGRDLIGTGSGNAQFSRTLPNGAAGETEDERRRRLDARLAHTSMGRAALARRNGGPARV